jgi:hypothetical protein
MVQVPEHEHLTMQIAEQVFGITTGAKAKYLSSHKEKENRFYYK